MVFALYLIRNCKHAFSACFFFFGDFNMVTTVNHMYLDLGIQAQLNVVYK